MNTVENGAIFPWNLSMSDEALKLADDLANINKAKNMWHFDEAAKHIRELSQRVKELEEQLNKLERTK